MWKFDAFLIRQFEFVCQKFQRLTGKTNFWIAGFVAYTTSVIVVLFLIAVYSNQVPSITKGYGEFGDKIFFIVMILANLTQGIYTWRELEAEAFRHQVRGLSNPRKIHPVRVLDRCFLTGLNLVMLGNGI